MGRSAGRMITYDDAIYMVANEGFTAKKTIPSSKQIMTKTKLNEYLELDADPLVGYALTQAVPYDKIQAQGYIYFEPDATVDAAYGGGTYTLQVRSNTSWSVSGSDAWTTVSPTSGSGDTILTITVGANPNYSTRQDTMQLLSSYVTGAYFYVSQAAKVDTTAPPINNFTVAAYSTNYVSWSWSTVYDDAGGSGLSRLVFYYRTVGGIWNATDLALTDTYHQVSGLNDDTTYEFKVMAQDNAGNWGSTAVKTQKTHKIETISVALKSGYSSNVDYIGGTTRVIVTSNSSYTVEPPAGDTYTVYSATEVRLEVPTENTTTSTLIHRFYFRTPNGTTDEFIVYQAAGGGGGGGTTTT